MIIAVRVEFQFRLDQARRGRSSCLCTLGECAFAKYLLDAKGETESDARAELPSDRCEKWRGIFAGSASSRAARIKRGEAVGERERGAERKTVCADAMEAAVNGYVISISQADLWLVP